MNTSKSPERLIFFSDAVVAIAMTLLILPLTDLIPELVTEHKGAADVFADHQWQIYSFLLSFVVISRFWIAHHLIFEQVKAYNRQLMVANLCWLFTIAVLPFPAQMVAGFSGDRLTKMFYIGTMLASMVCQVVIVLIIRRDPEVAHGPDSISQSMLESVIGNAVAMAIALAIAGIFPSIGYYGILSLPVVSWILRFRSWRRKSAEATASAE
jgi:uncharacterized membrane protein